MHYNLIPNKGANNLSFSMNREQVRSVLSNLDYFCKSFEPENDFYEDEGLILGYDTNDKLEYIEIISPSTVEFKGIRLFSNGLEKCIEKMRKFGYKAKYDDGGYCFNGINLAFYCPMGNIESVSLFKEGYYDD